MRNAATSNVDNDIASRIHIANSYAVTQNAETCCGAINEVCRNRSPDAEADEFSSWANCRASSLLEFLLSPRSRLLNSIGLYFRFLRR